MLNPFPAELNLLLHLLTAENGNTACPESDAQFTGIDWARFLELANHHRVVPLLYRSLKDKERARVPREVLQEMHGEYMENVIRMLHLSGEMERVGSRFAEKNIRILQLKGPGLAFDLYGDLSLRSSKDLDILIDHRDLDKGEQLLREMGYSIEGTVYTVLSGWKWRNYHKPFFHPQNKINVEIHWRLGPGPAREPHFDRLWESRRTGRVAGCPVFYLGEEDLVYYLVMHGARHGWFRIQWLRDIDRLAKRNLNWRTIGSHLSRYQALAVGGQALLLCSRLLATPLNDDMRSIAASGRSRRLANGALEYIREKTDLHDDIPPAMARGYKKYLYEVKTFRQKLLYLASTLYPHPLDAQTLPLPRPVHFLYFPLRPLLWIWRKARKHAWT